MTENPELDPQDIETPAIFEDADPDQIVLLAMAAIDSDQKLNFGESGASSIAGITIGSIASFASVRLSEIVAQILVDHPIQDETALEDILNIISVVGLTCYVEAFALSAQVIERQAGKSSDE